MPDKPKRASDYKSDQVTLVRATCLYVATKLGDLMDDLVIVGGLVPSLLIDQETLPEGAAGASSSTSTATRRAPTDVSNARLY
jgi:hypothetical protein